MESIRPRLRASGIAQVGWLDGQNWPAEWFGYLSFELLTRIISYSRPVNGAGPELEPSGARIRPALPADFELLAAIEVAAFEPLWRHSADAMRRAFAEACSFTVAELDGEVAGFQYSVQGSRGRAVHLVRMTVHPAVQRQGVGRRLMHALLTDARQMGAERMSLNTQEDNLAARRLYESYGFRPEPEPASVWRQEIGSA
jgi:ribosomal-protein-alanine N-acetyltransferase